MNSERIIKKISENIRKIQIEITSSKVESLKILNTLYNIIDNHPQKKDVVIKEYESALRLFLIQRNHLAAHLLHPTPLVAYLRLIHPAALVLRRV